MSINLIRTDKLIIEGTEFFDKNKILSAISKETFFTQADFKKTLFNIPWIQSYKIDRNYHPYTWLKVKERVPIAKTLSGQIITIDNHIINDRTISSAKLIKVSKYADFENILKIYSTLNAISALKKRVKLCDMLYEGRWDIYLDDKLVKLPLDQVRSGLIRLAKFMVQKPKLFRKAKIIDLRVEDDIFLGFKAD